MADPSATLNKRDEIMEKCKHKRTCYRVRQAEGIVQDLAKGVGEDCVGREAYASSPIASAEIFSPLWWKIAVTRTKNLDSSARKV